jgi:hypothetical protein
VLTSLSRQMHMPDSQNCTPFHWQIVATDFIELSGLVKLQKKLLALIAQVGVKGVAYLMLHGESIMDIVEVHQREVMSRPCLLRVH